MILASKYQNLELSELNVSAFILKKFWAKGVVGFDELQTAVTAKFGVEAKLTIMPALGLLYLLGRIVYNYRTDKVRFVKDEA